MKISRTIEDPIKRDSYFVGVLSGATRVAPVNPSVLMEAADAISDEGARTTTVSSRFCTTGPRRIERRQKPGSRMDRQASGAKSERWVVSW